MSRILLLGGAGSLGKHVLTEALNVDHQVTVVVRDPCKLQVHVHPHLELVKGDIGMMTSEELTALICGCDALINCAGNVAEGKQFTSLVSHIVDCIERVPLKDRPFCWFLGGAALLGIDSRGRRGVDLPLIRGTYSPHLANFNRLMHSDVDWAMLCPGPMVEEQGYGLPLLRVSADCLPVHMPRRLSFLPTLLLLPIFGSKIPEMIIPYADAAAMIVSNIAGGATISRRRVGLALPVGIKGRKDRWTAKS